MTTAEGATLRFGDFTCTFTVPTEGLYLTTLVFSEPCYLVGACAGGQVAAAGGRLLNVFINDTQVLTNFDPVAAGATNLTPAVRRFVLYSAALKFTVRIQTVKRSGLLYSIIFNPDPLATVGDNLAAGSIHNCVPVQDPDTPSGRSLYCSADIDCSQMTPDGVCRMSLAGWPWWTSTFSMRIPVN